MFTFAAIIALCAGALGNFEIGRSIWRDNNGRKRQTAPDLAADLGIVVACICIMATALYALVHIWLA